MIISKTVLITLNPRNIRHYESLGYKIPKYTDNKNRSCIQKETKIKVKVSDLHKNSHIKVFCKCDKCGKERTIEFNAYRNFCVPCSRPVFHGENHPCWNPNLTQKERLTGKNRILLSGYNKAEKLAKQRDGKCLICGSTKKLQGHHIQDFKHYLELRCDSDNIVTLCFEHHNAKNGKSIHSIYGRFPTKENWEEFYLKYHVS